MVTAFGRHAKTKTKTKTAAGGKPWRDLVKTMCQLERARHIDFCIGSRFGLLWPSKTYCPSPTPREHSPLLPVSPPHSLPAVPPPKMALALSILQQGRERTPCGTSPSLLVKSETCLLLAGRSSTLSLPPRMQADLLGIL